MLLQIKVKKPNHPFPQGNPAVFVQIRGFPSPGHPEFGFFLLWI